MTAVSVASPYAAGRPRAVAPAPSTPALRRVTGSLREPNAWTVALLLATGLTVIARHPLARMLGTEVDTTPAPVVTPALAHAAVGAQKPLPALAGAASVPTHAPVDPFSPLVSADGTLMAPAPLSATGKTPAQAAGAPGPTTVAPRPAAGAAACSGTVHRVVAGDSLWSMATSATHSTDSSRVTVAWHRIYAANRSTLGSDPSVVQVGQRLCVPAGI